MSTEQQAYDLIDPPKPLVVKFYDKPVKSGEINGVAVYEPRLMLQKGIKGENSSLSKVATERHKQEHVKEYEAYERYRHLNYTPLSALVDPMTAMSLNDQGIQTLDELAASEPLKLFDELREKARQILEIKNDRKETSDKKTSKKTCQGGPTYHDHNQGGNHFEKSCERAQAGQGNGSGGQTHHSQSEVMNYSWSM